MTKKIVVVMMALAFCLAVAPAFAAEDGKALYGAKCAMCHGADGVAKKMAAGARNFNDAAFKKEMTADAIAKVAMDGKGKMKAVKLTEPEAKAIGEYVSALK